MAIAVLPLQSVTYKDSEAIESVEDVLYNLKSKKYNPSSILKLSILNCKKLQIIVSIIEFSNLKKLDLSGSNISGKRLNAVVNKGWAKKTLTHLTLRGCHQIKKIHFVCALEKLRKLNLSHCSKLEEIHFSRSCNSLQVLLLDHCNALKGIWVHPTLKRLISLSAINCKQLEDKYPNGKGGMCSIFTLLFPNLKSYKNIEEEKEDWVKV